MSDATMAPVTALTGRWLQSESAEQQFRRLLEFAILAPSSHNTQPWLFSVAGTALEVRADRSRALPVVDPDDRALIISCGAALGFLRVAIRAAGFQDIVERPSDPADPHLLARVRIGEPRVASEEEVALLAAMRRRRTNRQAFEPRTIADAVLERLAESVRRNGVWLRIVTAAEEKHAVADLVADGDRRQADDPDFRRELAAWMRPNRSAARDGMRGAVHGVGDVASRAGPWIIRTFDWGNGQAAKDRQLATGSPALAILGSDEDTREAWLRAGEALGQMLLVATNHDLSASFLNQPIEVPALRPVLARTLGLEGAPQLLLRLGYGPEAPPTPRREVREVLFA